MTLVKEDRFVDRSTILMLPTRGMIPAPAYISHMALSWLANTPRTQSICVGKEVGEAYNMLFSHALEQKAQFAFTLEDDIIVPQTVLLRLHDALDEEPELTAVSALYNTKGETSIPLLLGFPEVEGDTSPRKPPQQAGLVETNVIPMGCALWRLSAFREVEGPWFQTTPHMTQDVYASLKLRTAGKRLAVDTRIRVGHFDVTSQQIY